MKRIIVPIVLAVVASDALAREIAPGISTLPAPSGEPKAVALTVLRAERDPGDCPKVVAASRAADGSIYARCSNGDTFMIFTVEAHGKPPVNIAINCRLAKEKLNVSCYK